MTTKSVHTHKQYSYSPVRSSDQPGLNDPKPYETYVKDRETDWKADSITLRWTARERHSRRGRRAEELTDRQTVECAWRETVDHRLSAGGRET